MKMYSNFYKIFGLKHTINNVYHCKNGKIYEDDDPNKISIVESHLIPNPKLAAPACHWVIIDMADPISP